jgi:hypothetical protein
VVLGSSDYIKIPWGMFWALFCSLVLISSSITIASLYSLGMSMKMNGRNRRSIGE